MKNLTVFASALLAMFTVESSIEAGGITFSVGGNGYSSRYGYTNPGFGYQNYYGSQNCYGRQGYSGGLYGYGNRYAPQYRSYSNSRNGHYNSGHYDYHAPSYQLHGNHIDFVPGHYDYHRNGHHGH